MSSRKSEWPVSSTNMQKLWDFKSVNNLLLLFLLEVKEGGKK